MTKCVFCGKEEKDFKGTSLIKNDGSVNYFCSSKCMKNSGNLNRDKRKVRWAEAFHITREKARNKSIENKEKAKAKEEAKKNESSEKTVKKTSKKKK